MSKSKPESSQITLALPVEPSISREDLLECPSNQLAVDPEYQSQGLGGELINLVELFAVIQGAYEIASDHAEDAVGYIEWKKKRGYRFIDYHKWSFTNYRSVILSKNLEEFNT